MRVRSMHCVLLALLLSGCSLQRASDKSAVPKPLASQLVEVSGGKQISGVGATLPDPLVVQVNGADGSPVAGVQVAFRGEGLKFTPSVATSDSSGQVSVSVQLGAAPGNYQVVGEAAKAGGGTVAVDIREVALGYEQKLGREVNNKHCIRCHDQESTPERVSNFDNLSPAPHVFSDGAFLNGLSDADLIKIITYGGPALQKSAANPAFAGTLTPAEIKAVVAYIRAIADPPYHAAENKP